MPSSFPLRLAVLFPLAVVALGVALQFTLAPPAAAPQAPHPWTHPLPAAIPGWSVHDEPLGDTDYQQATIARSLRFDGCVHRVFQRADRYVSVFVAWWAPGRLPTRLIAFHSPDICWTAQGWRCTAFAHRQPLTVAGHAWHPAEARTFVDAHGEKSHVLFWLLVAGEPYDFGPGLGRLPGPAAWFGDLRTRFARRPQDHLFVRLATNGAWEDCLGDAALAAALAPLGALGLAR